MVQYFLSSTDWGIVEYRAKVNEVVRRSGVRCRGYDEDGDAIILIRDELLVMNLLAIAREVGLRCYLLDVSQMGEAVIVDKR